MPNDHVAAKKAEERPEGFETTMGRGVYSAQDWHKARQYALPFVLDGCQIVAHVVLLLRIPGGQEGGHHPADLPKKAQVTTHAERPRGQGNPFDIQLGAWDFNPLEIPR